MPISFVTIAPSYAEAWQAMTINPSRVQGFAAGARKLKARLPRYGFVSAATGVPTSVIAVIHEREASGDFGAYLGNGQPWNRRTTIVPIGRGPFVTFDAAAIDALRLDGLDKITDWTVERALFVLEGFNGFGYRNKGLRSPYLWGGTSQQQPGKYVADGKFDPTVMDTQPGCAPMLFTLWQTDPSLALRLSAVSSAPVTWRLEPSVRSPEVEHLQVTLTEMGLYSGVIDGLYGPKTKAAVAALQAAA